MPETVHHVEHVMGTTVSFDVRACDGTSMTRAIGEAVAWLHDVDARFSTYRDDSEVTRLGRNEIATNELSADTAAVLRMCRELSAVTEGAFDAFAVPAVNGTTFDPSAYVKGWSIEVAATILEKHGGRDFCINGGGDIVIRGVAAPEAPWRIGIQHPVHADKVAVVVPLAGAKAIATSATYERGAHIIDPRDGLPVTHLASATVLGDDLGVVDAYATALFVMGIDGLDWIERQPGFEAFVITHDDVIAWTTDFVFSSD